MSWCLLRLKIEEKVANTDNETINKVAIDCNSN
nr:MAG TPA: hypothetical protein [Caudoviricetes sp.]